MLAFELFVVPVLTMRWGIRFCQRLGSLVEIPIYFIIPLISCMGSGRLLVPIAAVLLFRFLAGSDLVGCLKNDKRRFLRVF